MTDPEEIKPMPPLHLQDATYDALRHVWPDERINVIEIVHAIRNTTRYIGHNYGPTFYDRARRMIRVEVTHGVEDQIMRWMYDHSMLFSDPRGKYGPVQLEGVDMYVVPRLPAPGWRVINPFAKEA